MGDRIDGETGRGCTWGQRSREQMVAALAWEAKVAIHSIDMRDLIVMRFSCSGTVVRIKRHSHSNINYFSLFNVTLFALSIILSLNFFRFE